MDYKQIEYDNYTLHLINTDRFRTLNIEVFFSNSYNRKSKIYYTFLSSLLSNTTKKYNSKMKMNIKKEELYDLNMYYSFYSMGKASIFSCDMSVVNPKYVNNNLYDDIFSFLYESLFNPNVTDGKFDETEFNFSLDGIINSSKKSMENSSSYANVEFRKTFYDKTILKYPFYEKEEVYRKVKNEDVFEFYKNMFSNDRIDIFVLGDIEEDLIIKKVNKLFSKVKNNSNLNIDLYLNNKPKEKECIVSETKDYNQSILLLGYKFKNLSNYELRYVLPIYNMMLGGTNINNSILFTNVREKNSLCYYIASFASMYVGSLIIEAQISKTNYSKTLKLIKENIKMNKNIPGIEDLFVSSKKAFNVGLNDYYDNPYKIISRYYSSIFENLPNIEETRKIINELDINDVFELSKKLKLDTIYFLEGDKNE